MNKTIKLWQIVAIILAISALVVSIAIWYQSRTIKSLRDDLRRSQIELIISQDSISSVFYGRLIDSIRSQDSVTREALDALKGEQLKLNKKYEKIDADYSDIIIDRPEF